MLKVFFFGKFENEETRCLNFKEGSNILIGVKNTLVGVKFIKGITFYATFLRIIR